MRDTPDPIAESIRRLLEEDLQPVFKRVDTCAAEFESHTPYLYSTYEEEDEAGDKAIATGDEDSPAEEEEEVEEEEDDEEEDD